MIIPEYIRSNGVTTHGFYHPDTMSPVFFGNAGGMEFTTDDLVWFSIEQEFILTEFEIMFLLGTRECE
jgi:hypothetical protein